MFKPLTNAKLNISTAGVVCFAVHLKQCSACSVLNHLVCLLHVPSNLNQHQVRHTWQVHDMGVLECLIKEEATWPSQLLVTHQLASKFKMIEYLTSDSIYWRG